MGIPHFCAYYIEKLLAFISMNMESLGGMVAKTCTPFLGMMKQEDHESVSSLGY